MTDIESLTKEIIFSAIQQQKYYDELQEHDKECCCFTCLIANCYELPVLIDPLRLMNASLFIQKALDTKDIYIVQEIVNSYLLGIESILFLEENRQDAYSTFMGLWYYFLRCLRSTPMASWSECCKSFCFSFVILFADSIVPPTPPSTPIQQVSQN